ncbi:hypothetical protein CEXT_782371 [Caerostris extrusa]|uniref:Uncharacterized protein n=1 Tax=Caerostris extrusa TaxID=172846 RepID=A0AAV4MG17_CAEEX|nr:hypothetical protein CEXT_782371 [Caerostris extrusa]
MPYSKILQIRIRRIRKSKERRRKQKMAASEMTRRKLLSGSKKLSLAVAEFITHKESLKSTFHHKQEIRTFRHKDYLGHFPRTTSANKEQQQKKEQHKFEVQREKLHVITSEKKRQRP